MLMRLGSIIKGLIRHMEDIILESSREHNITNHRGPLTIERIPPWYK